MPDLTFEIEWPDGRVTGHYSPSTIVRQYLEVGQHLSVRRLLEVSAAALERASMRVEEVYGYRCSSALESMGTILREAERYRPDEEVTIRHVG